MPSPTHERLTLTVAVRSAEDLRTPPIRRVYVGFDYRSLVSRAMSELSEGQQLAWMNLDRTPVDSRAQQIPTQRRPAD